MNYKKLYNQIISNAQSRAKPDVYTERHHILPRALGGNDHISNLVDLTAREHFLAHYCLWKFSNGNARFKMAYAFNIMRMNPKGSERYINSRLYASLRKDMKHTDETKAQISASLKGKKQSAVHKAKMSKALKGRTSPMKGRTFTAEHKAKISDGLTGVKRKPLSAEHKARMSASIKASLIKLKARQGLKKAA